MYLWAHMSERSLCDKYTAKRQLLPLFHQPKGRRRNRNSKTPGTTKISRIKTTGM